MGWLTLSSFVNPQIRSFFCLAGSIGYDPKSGRKEPILGAPICNRARISIELSTTSRRSQKRNPFQGLACFIGVNCLFPAFKTSWLPNKNPEKSQLLRNPPKEKGPEAKKANTFLMNSGRKEPRKGSFTRKIKLTKYKRPRWIRDSGLVVPIIIC